MEKQNETLDVTHHSDSTLSTMCGCGNETEEVARIGRRVVSWCSGCGSLSTVMITATGDYERVEKRGCQAHYDLGQLLALVAGGGTGAMKYYAPLTGHLHCSGCGRELPADPARRFRADEHSLDCPILKLFRILQGWGEPYTGQRDEGEGAEDDGEWGGAVDLSKGASDERQ